MNRVYLLIISSLLFSACFTGGSSGKKGGAPVTTQCLIPKDQSGTIYGRWKTFPIPIATYQGSFSDTETAIIANSANTWNSFFNSSKGISIITPTGTSSVSNSAFPTAPCSQSLVANNQFTGNVVMYKPASWPFTGKAIAITLLCDQVIKGAPYKDLHMAVMNLNYIDYFTTQKRPDLQSIITHELGHLLGLNHSCELTKKANTPNCNAAGLNPAYISAIMFPVFGFDQFGIGQIKQGVGPNDQSRANCLYPTATISP